MIVVLARRLAWTVMLITALAVVAYTLVAPFVPRIAAPLLFTQLAARPAFLVAHLAGAAVALFTGVFQHNAWIRTRHPRLHRSMGLCYVVGVMLGGVGALGLAPYSEGGMVAHVGFGLLGALWIAFTLRAFALARAHRYPVHRKWMIRSYALTLAAVSLRIQLPLAMANGIPYEIAYPVIAWTAWVPNLVVAQYLAR
jgi:hypothetical protein